MADTENKPTTDVPEDESKNSSAPSETTTSSTSSTTTTMTTAAENSDSKKQDEIDSVPTTNGHDNNDKTETNSENPEILEIPEGEIGDEYYGEEEVPLDYDLEMEMAPRQPQLDTHLALIEEQFRRGFDERFSASKQPTVNKFWEDPMETMRTNKIFREVSRGLGCDWRPVFEELMATHPKEVLEMELGKIGQNPPIIQGYKALSAWKEVSGKSFLLMKLVDVLRNQDLDEIADAVVSIIDDDGTNNSKNKTSKSIQRKKSDLSSQKNPAVFDNRRLLLIAKKLAGDYENLAKELNLPEEELKEIKESEGATYQGAFKVLWAWKESRGSAPHAPSEGGEGVRSEAEELKEALVKVGKKELAEQLDELK